jgi:hypothetical protein
MSNGIGRVVIKSDIFVFYATCNTFIIILYEVQCCGNNWNNEKLAIFVTFSFSKVVKT